ncbi:WXG100 family type VII secretion target [Amycolatopsis speibonae]|uniref:ESAT-6-like protein n=1 Tax=Amycolatopsis speibonae TaxID=1450224 RepID=A0ABV7P242_9PSEU
MADATITYDYAAIEECVSAMQQRANTIQEETDKLASDAQKLYGAGWKGQSADAYKALADDLRNDLTANRENLENLKRALSDGASGMQHTDANGAKSF